MLPGTRFTKISHRFHKDPKISKASHFYLKDVERISKMFSVHSDRLSTSITPSHFFPSHGNAIFTHIHFSRSILFSKGPYPAQVGKSKHFKIALLSRFFLGTLIRLVNAYIFATSYFESQKANISQYFYVRLRKLSGWKHQ